MKRCIVLSLLFVFVPAAPAFAAPTPSPVAPQHTATACANVFAHNPQASEESRSAPRAQANFFAVADAFCF